MNDRERASHEAPPTPDPRIAGPVAQRLMELGIMQESVFSPGADVPTPEELTELLPEFEVESLIGKGGMGAVYRARQPSLDRVVALKVLVEPVADAGFAERFQREAHALASLSHPGIVSVYDFGRAGEYWYITMELVDGTDLRRVIDGRAMTPREALSIVSQVCEALQYAHDQGVVHRDIKPGNVLLDRDGNVKISDFGLAKMTGQRPSLALTRASQVMGTPHYMAPEQMETPLEVDHRADIYSVGVVLYELLTGELPMGNFALPSQRVQVDVRLDEVVLRALQKDPPKRYQSATAVRTDVDEVVKNPEPARSPAVRGSRPLLLAWSVAAGFAFLALLIGLQLGDAARPATGESPAASEVPAVTMLDLMVEEDGRTVTRTVEFGEDGAPRVTEHFAQAFGMDADAVARANEDMARQRRAYIALVEAKANATMQTRQELVQVQVQDFALDRRDIVEPTLVLLRGALGGRELPAEAAEQIERRLFPLGRGKSNLQLRGSRPVLTVNTEQGSYELEGEQVRREFEFLLGGRRARPALSVLPAIRAGVESLESLDWGDWQLELAAVNGRVGSGGGEIFIINGGGESIPAELSTRCRLTLQFYLDPVDASQLEGRTEESDEELRLSHHALATGHLAGLTSLGGLELSGTRTDVNLEGQPGSGEGRRYTLEVTLSTWLLGSWPGTELTLREGPLATGEASTLHAALLSAGLGSGVELDEERAALTPAPGFFTQRTLRMRCATTELGGSTEDFLAVLESLEAAGSFGPLINLSLERGMIQMEPDGGQTHYERSLTAWTTFQDRRAFGF